MEFWIASHASSQQSDCTTMGDSFQQADGYSAKCTTSENGRPYMGFPPRRKLQNLQYDNKEGNYNILKASYNVIAESLANFYFSRYSNNSSRANNQSGFRPKDQVMHDC
jgi:hypothetical protein